MSGLLLLGFASAWAQLPARLQEGFSQAQQLAEQGKWQKSEELYRRLIRNYPKLPELYNNLAVVLVQAGQPQKAVEVLEQGLRSHASYAALYDNLRDINTSLSSSNYMQALVPVQAVPPSLKASTSLSSLGEVYYGERPVTVVATAAPVVERRPEPAPVKPVAPSVPVVASKPAPATPPAETVTPLMDMETAARAALTAWAEAWSRQDVDGYVGAYVSGYSAEAGQSHAEWRKQRRKRLTRPEWIQVGLSGFQFFVIDNQQVAVQFDQSYRSNGYGDDTRKEVLLQREGQQWKISKEHNL